MIALDFIVLGLPRSGTSWIANWLTTDRTLCLHDPFAQGLPKHWPRDERRRGISCTLAYMLDGWLDRFDCPVAVIERPESERHASLSRAGMTPHRERAAIDRAFAQVRGRRFAFADLWNEVRAAELWAHLLPGLAFDALRYRQLVRVQVQPHPQHWTVDMATLQTLQRVGLLNTARA